MTLGLGKERSPEASLFVNISRGALAPVCPRALRFLLTPSCFDFIFVSLVTALQVMPQIVQAVPAGAGAIVVCIGSSEFIFKPHFS